MRSPDPKVTIVSGDPVTTVRELKAEVGGWESTWPAVPVTQGDGKRGEAVTIAVFPAMDTSGPASTR
jgi:hypothetical protein